MATPVVVDGILESAWQGADSIVEFYQVQPREGAPVSEPTVAYVMQTQQALCFALRCGTNGRTPDCRPGYRDGHEGDYVSVFLDTFHDRRTAYRFSVNCAGVQADEIVSADGKESNADWDGRFESAVTRDSAGYTVEIRIPWSTLRYDRKKEEWGFNLERAIPLSGELAFATPVRLNEGLRVSGFRTLTGLKPVVRACGIEIYPQGFYRTEKYLDERSETWKPALDLNWAITSYARLQSTVNSDFSQVEADPFALNLSKYSLYFREKRPFFVEGQEFFRPSGGVVADMLQVFYSRQIGQKLPDGTEVPLDAGLRMTMKWQNEEIAALGALTGEKTYDGFSGLGREPRAGFGVARWNHQFATPITGAVMAAGKFTDSVDNNVLSLDGTVSTATLQFTTQVARSTYLGTSDWAAKSYFGYFARAFSVSAYATIIGDRFDVSQIGFVPWYGLRRYSLSAGPTLISDSGTIVYGSARLTADVSREYGESRYSTSYIATLEASFRNNWGAVLNGRIGRERELFGSYNPRALSVSLSSDPSRRAWVSLSYYSVYEYNYARGHFGRSDYGDWYTSWRFSKRNSAYFNGSSWVERGPAGGVEEVTLRFRPGTDWAITDGMNTRLYVEIPVTKSDGLLSFRLGWAFSYNFANKSWLYLAFNDYQRREDGNYQPRQRVFAVKLKYLISI
ncbi:MAG TPA: DUF5916 domain-containing protein [bacterium]|nr:DUF5916 domain-containing protein [bacterium]